MGANPYLTIIVIFWCAGIILLTINRVLSITFWKREDVSHFAALWAGTLGFLNYSKYLKPAYIKHSKILDLIAVSCFLIEVIIILVGVFKSI